MTAPVLCSVIIPAYNAEGFIRDALDSVMRQEYPAIEVLVLDDGSTDGTAAIVDEYAPRVRCERLEHSGSPGAVRNVGIERSSGEFLCFLDADDIMAPTRISRQAGFLQSHPRAGVVFVDYRNFSAGSVADITHFQTCPLLSACLSGHAAALLPGAQATALLLQENFGGTGTAMVRRSSLDPALRFRPEFIVGEDFHFYYRIAREHDVGVINEVGLQRRLHATNVTADKLRVLRNYVASRAALRATESSPANLKLLDRCLFKAQIDLAREYSDRHNFGQSMMHNLRALAKVSATGADAWLLLRSVLRTGAMAARLKKPG